MNVKLVFKHQESKEVRISESYSLYELLDYSEDDIFEQVFTCDCKPVGESHYADCNCSDYFEDFTKEGFLKGVGLQDINSIELFEGDTVFCAGKQRTIKWRNGKFWFWIESADLPDSDISEIFGKYFGQVRIQPPSIANKK